MKDQSAATATTTTTTDDRRAWVSPLVRNLRLVDLPNLCTRPDSYSDSDDVDVDDEEEGTPTLFELPKEGPMSYVVITIPNPASGGIWIISCQTSRGYVTHAEAMVLPHGLDGDGHVHMLRLVKFSEDLLAGMALKDFVAIYLHYAASGAKHRPRHRPNTPPRRMAAAAFAATRYMIGAPTAWTTDLVRATGYPFSDVRDDSVWLLRSFTPAQFQRWRRAQEPDREAPKPKR